MFYKVDRASGYYWENPPCEGAIRKNYLTIANVLASHLRNLT